MLSLETAKIDYWASDIGITKRIEALSMDFSWRIVNGSLQAYGKKNKVKAFRGVGYLDDRICAYCERYIVNHKPYRLGQFMPRLPAHAR